MEDPFLERIRILSIRAYAIADQHHAAAREDLENLMDALRLPPEERVRLRADATPDRLYHPRWLAEFIFAEIDNLIATAAP